MPPLQQRGNEERLEQRVLKLKERLKRQQAASQRQLGDMHEEKGDLRADLARLRRVMAKLGIEEDMLDAAEAVAFSPAGQRQRQRQAAAAAAVGSCSSSEYSERPTIRAEGDGGLISHDMLGGLYGRLVGGTMTWA